MLVKSWLAVLVAGAVLAAAAVSALFLLGNGGAAVATDHAAATHASAGDDGDRAETGETGPPPWAHGHAGKQGHGPGAAWKALSPTQRGDLMKRLTTQHAKGMKAFGACVKAGRSDCEKPLPPGLAKRL